MDSLSLILYLFLGTLAAVKSLEWDVAVARADMLEFLGADGRVTRPPLLEHFDQPSALAYDAATGRMFLSDSGLDDSTIFQMDNETKVTALVPKLKGSVPGLAFHPGLQMLFWTTGSGGEIGSIRIGVRDTPAVVIKFTDGSEPVGIAVDVCPGGMMYWTNKNSNRPSIGRSDLAGKHPDVLISSNLHQPLGIAVDHDSNRLYWTDDMEGIYFRIESCKLDGRDRRTIVHSTYHQPYALAIGPDMLYYTDWSYHSVWSVPKDGRSHEPTQMHKFSDTDSLPMGLATRGPIECRPIKQTEDVSEESTLPNDDFTTVISRDPPSDYCLNAGELLEGRCECQAGFTGPRCEREACFNFCLAGKCVLGINGTPSCVCPHKYEGVRCEVEKCRDYCVNGGCVLDRAGRQRCQCDFGFHGPRCQLNSTAAIGEYEIGGNETSALGLCSSMDHSQLHTVALAGLAGLSAVLAVAVAVLTRKVVVLRRRPRIRKQIIVKKNVTPLTSRPPQPGDTCEITIENCCNMNICETPCFEPQLRSSKSTSRKEEKAGLLGSMEEEPSCSSGDHSQLY